YGRTGYRFGAVRRCLAWQEISLGAPERLLTVASRRRRVIHNLGASAPTEAVLIGSQRWRCTVDKPVEIVDSGLVSCRSSPGCVALVSSAVAARYAGAVIQVCSRCGTRWNVHERRRAWCPRCNGALWAPLTDAQEAELQWSQRAAPAPAAAGAGQPPAPRLAPGYRWIA